MKKIVRLTEDDLTRIVKKVIIEEQSKNNTIHTCASMGIKSPGYCDTQGKKPVIGCASLGVKTSGYCYVDTKKPIPNQVSIKKLKEFFNYEDNRGKNFGYFDKMSSQLGKFVMTSVSIIGREKTAELLSSVAEMINYANNDDTSSQSDYRQLDITSDIMDYLSEIE